jgi:molecular chaperone GrpE
MTDHQNGSLVDAVEERPEQETTPEIDDTAGRPDEGEAGESDARAARLAELERETAEWQDRYLRAVADMENLKRRHRQEMEEARRYGNEQLLGSLVSVLDNLQRALDASTSSENFAALIDGVSLTHKQLLEVLTRGGLSPIEAVGQPFDPTLHEAIGHVEAPEGEAPDTVVEEVQRGYTLNGRLLRPSLVRIAG